MRPHPTRLACLALAAGCALTPLPLAAQSDDGAEYRARINVVLKTPGLAAFWDFVKRDAGADGHNRFDAYQPRGASHDFRLDAINYVRDYWDEGRAASYDDFPLLGRGPFGQALQLRAESDAAFRPTLVVPRERLHNSRLDVKGKGRPVSMVAWVVRESGNHAIAGIWHEGTDLKERGGLARRVEPGKRQYAIFAGLAANDGASAVHVSENGRQSFGDKYARNLAVTPEPIPTVAPHASPEAVDAAWSAVGFVFDNKKNTVTAYLNGNATEYWIDAPEKHPFFRWPANGWLQAELRRIPGAQPGEDSSFPADQFYTPPEKRPLRRETVSVSDGQRIEMQTFEFTKVRVTYGKDAHGKLNRAVSRELVALKANPFWFGHDLYAPARPEDGGPFTIGRVIHSGRSVGFTGYIGGIAVFHRALTPNQMKRLAAIAQMPPLAEPDLKSSRAESRHFDESH